MEADGTTCFLSAGRSGVRWPSLVVAQRFTPDTRSGFGPGALLAPDTGTLFLGAGTRLLAYELDPPKRLWEDEADTGFWSWRQYGQTVIMAAELEVAAWTAAGNKLWSTFVEPPWDYTVKGDTVDLDVMGKKSQFPLAYGPGRG